MLMQPVDIVICAQFVYRIGEYRLSIECLGEFKKPDMICLWKQYFNRSSMLIMWLFSRFSALYFVLNVSQIIWMRVARVPSQTTLHHLMTWFEFMSYNGGSFTQVELSLLLVMHGHVFWLAVGNSNEKGWKKSSIRGQIVMLLYILCLQ